MQLSKSYNHSYWELKHYFKCYDLIIIGSGIVGLSTAISFKDKNKKASVLILERGFFPNGASTKNAGFACFGSPSELLSDLKNTTQKIVWQTVKMRWEGLKLLKNRVGVKNLNYKNDGGFELYNNEILYENSKQNLTFLNTEIKNILGLENCFKNIPNNKNMFKKTIGLIKNKYEGQLDSDLMMRHLTLIAQKKGVEILNGVFVNELTDLKNRVELKSDIGIFKSKKVVIATNGFANQLLKLDDLKPARAQVLITKPIRNLKIKGCYHLEEGYYYFRNIDNRILFGGGRNLDFKKETTIENSLNNSIQKKLESILKTIILPTTHFEIEHRWTGIMGLGSEKMPIIKNVSLNCVAAVRMGGMGIAIGSKVGEEAANLVK